jgi:Right handed beta helix region
MNLNATNRYVSGTGNDANNGLSPTTAYRNLQKAADIVQSGDTVFVLNGTYVNEYEGGDVVNINRAGTANQWIVFINYQNHTPKLVFNGWGGFIMTYKAAYIEINGFDVEGNNSNVTLEDALNQSQGCNNPGGDFQPQYNGNGIAADGRGGSATQRPHHIRILNNKVHDCGGGGIGFVQTDYVTVRNNEVYNNAWYTIFGNSGISLYQCWNSDNNTTDFKNVIENNICHHNRLFVPWVYGPCAIYDGNGIIIDDNNNTQNASDLGIYTGKTVIQNNLLYKNGGSGAHVYESQNVTIRHNTAYRNSQSPETVGGEIFSNTSKNVAIVNNILFAADSNVINSNYQNINLVYQNNLHWNGTSAAVTNNTCKVANPLFVDEDALDFRLLPGSPCIDKASNANTTNLDINGIVRPQGILSDIGAYEFVVTNAIETPNSLEMVKVYPNPSDGVAFFETKREIDYIVCVNTLGQRKRMVALSNKIDLTGEAVGLYQLIFYKDGEILQIVSFVKE